MFAQFERTLIGQRTREALAVKRSQGVRLGRPRVVPEQTASAIRRRRMRGQTLAAIAAALNRDGLPTAQGCRRWYVSTIQSMIRSAGARS
ncbi:MAG TPA: recombinase family protein [Candidatus Limnocylindria bacterium]